MPSGGSRFDGDCCSSYLGRIPARPLVGRVFSRPDLVISWRRQSTSVASLPGDLYNGIPVDRLPIEAVDVPDPRTCGVSDRYVGAVGIEPEHAVEAVFNPRRLVARDPQVAHG